jgi:hypothetical protein
MKIEKLAGQTRTFIKINKDGTENPDSYLHIEFFITN